MYAEEPVHVLVVIGTPAPKSVTATVMTQIAERIRKKGGSVDILDLSVEPLPLFNPETAFKAEYYAPIRQRVLDADVIVVGTPDYHGSISSTLKNFLDHFWKEYAGKLMASVVGSFEKGLTVTDQIRTVARQSYAWSMPYAMAFQDKEDIVEKVFSETFTKRVDMFARDVVVYGKLLAEQRKSDLEHAEVGFMVRYRKPVA
ncbi:MAG: putative NADPH-dependent reductase [Verrucomicrobia bacterium]|jgi:FMN reductase|nr:putative NADPH-dependent reductase [Verrucomicrobiota bacterium]